MGKPVYLFDNFSCRHFERPERITKIEEGFGEYELKNRMHMLQSREASTEELCLAHSWRHVDFMRKSANGKKDLREMGEKFNSIYLHATTFKCAKLAVGSTLEVMDNVLNGNYQKGISVVRPPGHHAEEDHPHGFCIFNNVALAAQYALKNHGLKRLVLDFAFGKYSLVYVFSNSRFFFSPAAF